MASSRGDAAPRPGGGERPIDVLCIGNALVDHLAFAGEEVLETVGLARGGMTLVDIPTTERIAAVVGEGRQVPGGMVTNSAVGVASLGGTPAYIGAVAEDEPGERFAADLEAAGVRAVLERFPVDPSDPDAATGRCFVVVTPDGERTMATALGVAGRLDRNGIDPAVIASARLVFLEGYVLDLPDAEAIVDKVVAESSRAGTWIALGLADSMLVERHHSLLLELVTRHVGVVFANEAEIGALTGERSVEAALAALARPGLVAVATCGRDGAVVAHDGSVVAVPAHHVEQVVDRTGAGDLFAGGFCFGLTHGTGVERAAQLGSLAAAEVIAHLGARPETSLAARARAAGLL